MTRAKASCHAVLFGLVLALGAMPALADCPRGQETNADTNGHCCWPGQAWSNSRVACIGIPVCPPGYEAQGEACFRSACPAGQAINDDTQDHCCWPGQVWSNSKSRCVGVPQKCPEGRARIGEDCAPAECPAGQVRMKVGACCWPGQTWWGERATCVGTPTTCPHGTTAKPEGCISTGWTQYDGAVDANEAGQPAAPAGSEPGPETWTPPPLLDALRAPPQLGEGPADAPPPTPGTNASGAPVAAGEQAPVEEAPKGPKSGRTSLHLGLLLNDGFAGAFQIRASPRLVSILKDTSFKGTLVLLIEPWLYVGGEADRGVGWFRTGLALNLGMGWEQTLGPLELTLRVGVLNGFTFRVIPDPSASSFGFNYEFKGVFGGTIALPAGEGTKFVIGFDAYPGAPPLFLLSIGVIL